MTDDLCTQVYEAETDEETDSDDDTDKMNNNENAVSTGNKKGVTDSSEGQGQREEMRKSAATMEVQVLISYELLNSKPVLMTDAQSQVLLQTGVVLC